jgi:hypothetical protein
MSPGVSRPGVFRVKLPWFSFKRIGSPRSWMRAWRDSNPQPSDPKSEALSGWATGTWKNCAIFAFAAAIARIAPFPGHAKTTTLDDCAGRKLHLAQSNPEMALKQKPEKQRNPVGRDTVQSFADWLRMSDRPERGRRDANQKSNEHPA